MSEAAIRRWELAAYGVVIVVALIPGSTAIEQRLMRSACPAPARTTTMAKAAPFGIPGVDWKANENTLLLALSTTCRYCEESAGFYRTLLANRDLTSKVHIVAVFPQPVGDSERFLVSHGLSGLQAKQAMLWQMGVSATPTAMLIDASGNIVESWVGKLKPAQEAALIARLRNR